MSESIVMVISIVALWRLIPLIFVALYADALRDYKARRRRSVAITPGNAWLGLFVETWDGQQPSRQPYVIAGEVGRWLFVILVALVWWR
jgi:hypothetical protein